MLNNATILTIYFNRWIKIYILLFNLKKIWQKINSFFCGCSIDIKYPQYLGSLTREQFLYYEVKIVAQLVLKGLGEKECLDLIIEENLFQLPTEKSVKSLFKGIYKRLMYASTPKLVELIAYGVSEVSKQASLYLLMRYNKIVYDFMVYIIGEKYKNFDFSFDKHEVSVFMNKLQCENEMISSWSESTINKIKSILVKCLSDTGYLNNIKSNNLNPVFLYDEVLECIEENGDFEVLPAFNYLK